MGVVGLRDKKPRKFIRQIGEKKNAISPKPYYEMVASNSEKNEKPLSPEE